ncbi:MAG: S8 family peptidase [Thermoplasmata archaeon]
MNSLYNDVLVKIQLNDLLTEIFGSSKNFSIVKSNENTIKVVRLSDQKSILIRYPGNFCSTKRSSWFSCVRREILETFYKTIHPEQVYSSDDNNEITWIISFKKSFNLCKCSLPKCVKLKYTYTPFFNCICCVGTEKNICELRDKIPEIEFITPDIKVESAEIGNRTVIQSMQSVGDFIKRIGAIRSSQKSGDGTGSLENRSDINVFIVDTGISRHPDLNIVSGINFTSNNPNDWEDRNGHGTHVSGIVGARDNNFGVVGVAPGVRLWAIKVLGDDGNGTLSKIILGLKWILKNKGKLWNGYGIINMSLGSRASWAFDVAIDTLIDHGMIPVVAAGNQSIDAFYVSPARVSCAITVGATTTIPSYNSSSYYNTLAWFSNYGRLVDILAPGVNIPSTFLNGGYATLSGTSMAAAVVTGTVALMLSSQHVTGTNTSKFVENVRNKLVSDSAIIQNKYADGNFGFNPRIIIPTPKNETTTNISVWAGRY